MTGNRPLPLEEVHQQRETVIRFQLENEVMSSSGEVMKSDVVAASATAVSGEIDIKTDCIGGGTNKLGQLYFKVR